MTVIPFTPRGGGNYVDNLPVYSGSRVQRGYGLGSMLSGLLKKTVLPLIKKKAISLGKSALKTGLQVAGDAMQGENIGSAAKRRFTQAGMNTLDGLMSGNSTPKRRKRIAMPNKTRRPAKRLTIRSKKRRRSRPNSSDIFGV